jgi:hypothetical protein
MVFAMLLLTAAANWVPMRWTAADPASLAILKGTPVNCLLLEKAAVNPKTVEAATKSGIETMAVIGAGATEEQVQSASAMKLKGVVFEGDYAADAAARLRKVATDSGLLTIDLPPRSKMRFDAALPVVGTYEGVWPGIRVEEEGAAKAAPSGGPWIDTNSGFLRFVRAATDAPVWIGVRPPAGSAITAERYMQAISDAAIVGARWILALDEDLQRRLLAGEEPALKAWQRIVGLLSYFESHNDWRTMKPAGELAILQDVDSGALLSGGVLDMIAVKHTPVRPVPTHSLDPKSMQGTKMAVNVDPGALSDAQKQTLRTWTRSGGTLLNGPATWKFPAPQAGQITLSDADVKTLDDIWKEMNSMTGRRNLGVRLFNVSSMLSNFTESADRTTSVLQLVNYSGFPVENVTVHLLGKFKSAQLLAPGAPPKKVEAYEVEEGTGVDIDGVNVAATLLMER